MRASAIQRCCAVYGAGGGCSHNQPIMKTTLASSRNPSKLGQAVTFTATVAGTAATPTGTVTLLDGTTPLATATLAGALIPVPGGLGITEGVIKEQLSHLGGVAEGTAFASMLLVRFATLWFAVLVGFVATGERRHLTLTLDDFAIRPYEGV